MSVYPDAMQFKLSRMQGPDFRVRPLVTERYARSQKDQDADVAGALALSWFVDQLDLTGRWGGDS